MSTKSAAVSSSTPTKPQRPAGMARVGSVANAPWFHLAEGNVIHGILENCYSRPDERAKSGRSKFFQIRLVETAKGRIGRGKDAEIKDFAAGTIMNLNYGPKTKEFEAFIPDILRGAEIKVWAHVEGPKFSIGKGQTMWPIDVAAEVVKPAKGESEPTFGDDDVEDESEAA